MNDKKPHDYEDCVCEDCSGWNVQQIQQLTAQLKQATRLIVDYPMAGSKIAKWGWHDKRDKFIGDTLGRTDTP